MQAADLAIVDEVETAISTGSAEKRLETVKRMTDLFLSSAGSFNSEQIELFDNVLERLIKTIEIRAIADVSARIALAEVSTQLVPVSRAPPSVVRRLARHDEITIAGPVLTESARLSAEDLVEVAETKGEQHLLAIAGRWWLKEVVTDALLARRYPSVSRRIVNNPGARVSAGGFAIIVAQTESDPESLSKRESGSICRRSSVIGYCETRPKRSDRGCCRAPLLTFLRKYELQSQPSQQVLIAKCPGFTTSPQPSASWNRLTTRASLMKQPCSVSPNSENMRRLSQPLPSCRNPPSRSSGP
jgi:hypothetical protein